jgi:thioredoxin reductase (NADPH)
MDKVTILGSGPAGLTAAIYTARAGLEPLVIEGLQPGGQLTTTTEVENFPGFENPIDGFTLTHNMRKQAERFGTRFMTSEVTAVDFSGQPLKITLSGEKTEVESETVVVATGASARYLGLESEQKLIGRGVSGCATCDGAFFRDQPVAVIGGGDTAMEDALFLARMCSNVKVIHRRDEFRASPIMGKRVLENDKIDVIWDTVLEDVLDVEKNEVTGLRLKNVKTGEISEISVTGVFIAIGHTPNTKFFKGQLEVDDKGFLVTDNTKTRVPGVYAAGDVQDPVYKQAITAAGTGCMAALEITRYMQSKGL